jgi:hypothetical protein
MNARYEPWSPAQAQARMRGYCWAAKKIHKEETRKMEPLTYTRTPLGLYTVTGEVERGTRKCRIDIIVGSYTRTGTSTYSAKRAQQVVAEAVMTRQARADAYVIVPLIVDSPEKIAASVATLAKYRRSKIKETR